MRIKTWFTAAILATTSACVGQAPGGPAGDDTGDDEPSPPDAAPVSENLRVSGTAMDYFTGLPVDGAQLATEGMDPPSSTTSGPDGTYVLDEVLPGSLLYVIGTKTNYRTTRGDMLLVADTDAIADQYLVSNADAQRQYANMGLTPAPDTAIAIGNLLRNNGTPLEGVPLADITLVDALDAPVGLGPYFFGENGDMVDNLTLAVSTAFGTPPRARVGFLDVPPGSYTMKVNYLAGGGGGGGQEEIRTFEVPVVVVAAGAALVRTGGQDDDGGGDGGGGGGTPTFTQIHQMLQRGGDGGLGCANCHTAAGTMPALQFDLPIADAHAAIIGRLGVVDLANPALSLLLTKPLYEQPPALQNHPNATFANELDPGYQMILAWITAGALNN